MWRHVQKHAAAGLLGDQQEHSRLQQEMASALEKITRTSNAFAAPDQL